MVWECERISATSTKKKQNAVQLLLTLGSYVCVYALGCWRAGSQFARSESICMYVGEREIIERETINDLEGAATISDSVKKDPKLTVR